MCVHAHVSAYAHTTGVFIRMGDNYHQPSSPVDTMDAVMPGVFIARVPHEGRSTPPGAHKKRQTASSV